MQTICRAFEEENTALRAHAERLAEALEGGVKNAGKGSMNGKPTWHFRSDDVDIISEYLTLYRAENPKV